MTDTSVAAKLVDAEPLDSSTAHAGRSRLRFATGIWSPSVIAAGIALTAILSWAFVPEWWTPYDPLIGDGSVARQPPSWGHPFGTDAVGRDIFSRVVYGSALSLRLSLLAVGIAFVASSVIGLLSGFVGGWLDEVLMRVIDVLLSVPSLLISLLLVTALGFGPLNIAIAVGIGSVAQFSRVMRSEVLKVRTSGFVEAAQGSGARWWTVLWRHVFPHAATPVIALVALEFGGAILSIAALNFLGYGAQPPTPEWGNLVADGRQYLATAWWMTTLPGLVIVALVLATNTISRALSRERA